MRIITQSGKSRKSQNGRSKIRNSNVLLPVSVSEAIHSLTDELSDESFAHTYLKSEYLSKFNDSSPGSADMRRSAAISKWLSVERENALFSQWFVMLDEGYNILPRVTYRKFISFARRLVSDVLGELTSDIVVGTFSGGASTSRTRRSSEKSGKFVGMADITESAMPFVDVIHHEAPLLRQYGAFYSLREVEGAILFTVPKNADIDRCACKEPDINMFLQKAVGRHIRRQLRSFGINLNDQSVNRKLAREGSLTGDLATIDLSSASDTVNTVIVRALLPELWFDYLNDIRSKSVSVDGETHRTSMFSSMGNGFTFELESLIFWALMKTTAYFMGSRGAISVYGDDIIVPSRDFDMFSWVLKTFGFKVNPKKSYSTGSFRESCGGHYHNGEDVTPFYLRRPAKNLTDLIRICNRLRKWSIQDPIRRYADESLFTLWSKLASFVPKNYWGGHDLDLDTQLVSPSVSSMTLKRLSTRKRVNELGRYLDWHCDNWKRSTAPDDMSGAFLVDTQTVCRQSRTKRAYSNVELFYEEQFSTTIPE